MAPSRDVPELSLGKFLLGIGPNVNELRENYVARTPEPRRHHHRQSSAPPAPAAPAAPAPPEGPPPPPFKAPSDAKSAEVSKPPEREKAAEAQEKDKANSETKKKNSNDEKGAGDKGKENRSGGLTEEQDKKLRELKTAGGGGKKNKGGKPWKEIAEEMGFDPKDIGMLKNRWKELEGGAANGDGGGGGGGGGGGAGKDDAKEKKPKSGGSGGEKKEKTPPPAPAPAIPTTEQVEIVPDETFSVEDLALLIHIVRRDQSELWLRASARFFDKTGRRPHPEDIEKRFTGKVSGISYNFGTGKVRPAGQPRRVVDLPPHSPFVIVEKDGKDGSGGGKGSMRSSSVNKKRKMVSNRYGFPFSNDPFLPALFRENEFNECNAVKNEDDVLDEQTKEEVDTLFTQGQDDGVRNAS
ncbi:MAG: hypothetical protein M1831_005904 [Alyxoria varia]|nr:MAG: hypothetical protein M1831_005904 [Alyxoria varia]